MKSSKKIPNGRKENETEIFSSNFGSSYDI